MAPLGIETPDPRPPPQLANLKSWTSCAGMAPHAVMDNVGSKAETDMDFDGPVAGLSVSTVSRLRFLDCVTVSPPGPHPRPTPRRPRSTPRPTASQHHHPSAPHLHTRPTRTPRPTPHRVPEAAPGRTAPALPTDRRARTRSHSTPRIPRAVRPHRQRQTRSMRRSPRSCTARMIRFGIVDDQASSSQVSPVLIFRNSNVGLRRSSQTASQSNPSA
ncbi:hypothetical protein JB92DRAFT_1039077 [Gautieria morchelliformis]|nr:hypothetical protein JB92DRAFT_1039077 [Gautieria morchelliformis]